MEMPADGHVHSEWSWDADLGSMEVTCARAVQRGIPAVAFTEHVDFTPFRAGFLGEKFGPLVSDGILTAPELDVAGYQASLDRCRARFPELRILSGMEVGQPHRHPDQVAGLLAQATFDRVIGSLHCLPDGDAFAEPWELFPSRPADVVFREYLAEIPAMVAGSDAFSVFGHLDYPVRSWPGEGRPFDPRDFEEELRFALRSLAAGERVLEINTRVPLDPLIVGWWRAEGGRRVSFGSDAHQPELLGEGLVDAAAVAAAHGFGPATQAEDPWTAPRRPVA